MTGKLWTKALVILIADKCSAAYMHVQGLIAVQAVLCDEGSGGRSWGAGGVAQSPGKRKRTRKRWCLQHIAQAPLQDEVSCIHLLSYPPGDPFLTPYDPRVLSKFSLSFLSTQHTSSTCRNC